MLKRALKLDFHKANFEALNKLKNLFFSVEKRTTLKQLSLKVILFETFCALPRARACHVNVELLLSGN
jgi:hypothetical protein